jgi:four helix bundle protein
MEKIGSAKDLRVYQKAYTLAMGIFQLSQTWPKEEKYALIDQIRRSSRSVCANLREAWAKRRYEAHFINKLTDADGENSETGTWLDFAFDCGYIAAEDYRRLVEELGAIGSMLGAMLSNPTPFLIKRA